MLALERFSKAAVTIIGCMLSLFTDNDLLLKYMASASNAWPTSQGCQSVVYNADVIPASDISSLASDVCHRYETGQAACQPSSVGYSTAPSTQHPYQHSVSYPPCAG